MHWIYNFYIIIHGISASIISMLFFFLLGIVFLPRRILTTINCFPFFVGLVGFVILSITCFYALQCNISLYHLFQWSIIFLISLLIIRRKHCLLAFKTLSITIKEMRYWGALFVLFYILVFIFLPQPDYHHYLPLVHLNNTDIFNYINITQDILLLNHYYAAPFYIHPFSLPYSDLFWGYYKTPAVYYLHAWIALFYDNNALNAAMPTLYTTVSLIGLMITYYCYRFFYCSRWISAGIAAIVLCGSFYRLIIDFYFLSSLMGTVVWLASIIMVLQWDFSLKINKQRLIHFFIILLSLQSLLFLLYPIFFWLNLPILSGIIIMLLFMENPSRTSYMYRLLPYLVLLLLGTIIAFVLFPQFSKFLIHEILSQADRSKIIWSLPLLSPLAIFGFPVYLGWLESKIILAFFVIAFVGLFYCFYRTQKTKNNVYPAYVLSLMAIGALLIYWLYFYIEGSLRYQPWKFASYFLLPLAGVFWGLFFNTLTHIKHYQKIFSVLLIFCLLGNFFFYYYKFPEPFKNKYAALSILNTIPEPTLMTKMDNFSATYLAKFFIHSKELHSLNYSLYTHDSLNKVSDSEPFFVESRHGCEFPVLNSNAKSIVIKPIGCLYLGIPLLEFNKHYYFKNNLPFIETHGLFEFFVESSSNKRWAEPKASITFYVSKKELEKHSNGYVNFQVSPFNNTQNVFITWGKNHHTLEKVNSKQWISLPYTPEDWDQPNAQSSQSFKTITFQFRFPDAKSPHDLNVYSLDLHPRSVDFLQFFISDNSLPSPDGSKRIQAVGSGK